MMIRSYDENYKEPPRLCEGPTNEESTFEGSVRDLHENLCEYFRDVGRHYPAEPTKSPDNLWKEIVAPYLESQGVDTTRCYGDNLMSYGDTPRSVQVSHFPEKTWGFTIPHSGKELAVVRFRTPQGNACYVFDNACTTSDGGLRYLYAVDILCFVWHLHPHVAKEHLRLVPSFPMVNK